MNEDQSRAAIRRENIERIHDARFRRAAGDELRDPAFSLAGATALGLAIVLGMVVAVVAMAHYLAP